MFTPIDKNLLIAAMESAIYQACVNANVVSLHAIETGVSALRQKFDATPESVSDEDIFLMVETIERATIPALSIVSAIDNDSNIADRVVSFLWKNIVDKPTTFPPATHTHPWSEISYKPISYPPETHTHPGLTTDWNALTSKPTTFPPATHTHVKADVSDFPATLPPDAHTHVKADVSDFPATLPGRIEVVSWVGNGAATRILSLSGEFVPQCGVMNGGIICALGNYWTEISASSVTMNNLTVDPSNYLNRTYNMIVMG